MTHTAQTIAQQLLKITNPIAFFESISLTKNISDQHNQISFWTKLESKLKALMPISFAKPIDQKMVQRLEQQYDLLCNSLDSKVDREVFRNAARIAAQCNVKAMAILQELEYA